MANKTFCPIMTIGFDPPKEGKRDNRTCMKDCTWYNVAEEKCNLNVIADHLEVISSLADDMTGMMAGCYDDYTDDSTTRFGGYGYR